MIFLVIKGTRESAFHAAEAHRVKINVQAENERNTEVYAYAPNHELAKIIDWFCEDSELVLPAGALLFYNPKANWE